jgi:hypothetical protein
MYPVLAGYVPASYLPYYPFASTASSADLPFSGDAAA